MAAGDESHRFPRRVGSEYLEPGHGQGEAASQPGRAKLLAGGFASAVRTPLTSRVAPTAFPRHRLA
jgi:hypothetical protein